jgi:glutathione S-transferase
MNRTLYIGNKNLSSWSLRPWLLMRQAQVPFTEKVMLFEDPSFRARIAELSPNKRVPLLVDGDVKVWESLAICEHIAERFPEAQLWPSDAGQRAHARALASEMHAGFAGLRRDLSMDVMGRYPAKPRAHDTERDIARVLEIWSHSYSHAAGPFLFGSFGIVDAMFAPVAFRFRGYGVAPTGRAQAYMAALLALPAMREWEQGAEREVQAHETVRKIDAALPHPGSAEHVFAVIFSSKLRPGPELQREYAQVAQAMDALAKTQPGYLGMESARGADGLGITVSYWSSMEAIAAWKQHPEHRAAQARGNSEFYASYDVRICPVERGYSFAQKEVS